MVLLAAFATLLLIRYTSAAPADFPGDETPYRVIPKGTVSPDIGIGTWLYGYLDCDKNFGNGAKGNIDEAYYDAWLISKEVNLLTKGVASDIDWNNAAALDFLGAPGLNIAQRPQILAVFANTATIIYNYKNPFQHYIKIRCDDPLKKCQNRPDQHPPPNPGDRSKSPPLAYALNSDPDSSGTPMINFCEGFFARRSLADAIKYGMSLADPHDQKLANYDNRAQTFLHELFHLDLAADSPSPNPRVDDLQINIKVNNDVRTYMAYGSWTCKVLARWQGGGTGVGSVGYYVQRNADNLAYYALAKYVMSKNGDTYPHLPYIWEEELAEPPNTKPDPGSLSTFVRKGNNFYLNTTDDLSSWESSLVGDHPSCPDNLNESEVRSPLFIDGFAPDSAYPDDYNSQVSAWKDALPLPDGGSDSGSGGETGQQIANVLFINPL
ncbi:hypothetical protein BDV25DRAFT_139433 [Aspergillus avenaceus]|uniref:Uncharacterized protein n=1 Tax=Aspergillus avenaceus TaxID=36643 RepID=A0A5N6TWS2_ASPAV|nr:hypothetical protein BDV25DRAFT_139433 [Aspergillus avenaceus]